MLNDEDRKKLAFLDHIVRGGKTVSDEEVRWLIDRLQAALTRPDEFDFPEYTALVDPLHRKGYALLRIGMPDWKTELFVDRNSRPVVFETHTDCDIFSAYLVVRPWIRICGQTPKSAVDVLRRCTLSMTADDLVLVDKSPAEFFLIDKNGVGIHRWLEHVRPLQHPIYSAYALLEGKLEADSSKLLGIFVARDTKLSVKLHGLDVLGKKPIKIVAGLTAMLYTTKGPGGGEKLSIPREIKGIGT